MYSVSLAYSAFSNGRDIRQGDGQRGRPKLIQYCADCLPSPALIGHEHAIAPIRDGSPQPELGDARKHVAVDVEKRDRKAVAQPGVNSWASLLDCQRHSRLRERQARRMSSPISR